MLSIVKTLRKYLVIVVMMLGVFALSAQGAHAVNILDIGGAVLGGVRDVLLGILNALLSIITTILGVLLANIAVIADTFMQPTALTTNPVVIKAWGITRDFANMFFILILLGIALDFILFNSFKVKQMIPRLVLIALLINFSLPLAGVLIDFANVFTTYFLSQTAGTGSLTVKLANSLNISSILNVVQGQISSGASIASLQANLFATLVFGVIFMFGTAFVFLVLALMFLVRTGYLYVLLVTLPLVLVLSAFPPTSGHFRNWTNSFIKWTMFAPIATFFLWFALFMYDGLIAQAGLPDAGLPFIQSLYKYVVVWILLLGALLAAQSMGGKASGIALGAAGWVKGKTIKGLKRGSTAGLAAAGRRMKADERIEGFANRLQNMGLDTFAGGVRSVGAKTKMAMAKREELSAQKKAELEALPDSALAAEQERYEKSFVPGSAATAAHIAGIRARKGKLNVRNAKGEIDQDKTNELVERAYQAAKSSKNRDAMKAIAKSNPLMYGKIKEREFEEGLAKGEVVESRDPDTNERVLRNVKTGEFLHDVKNQALDDMTTTDFENLKGAWDKKAVAEFINGGAMTSGHLRMANNAGDRDFLNHIQETMNDFDKLTQSDLEKAIKGFMVLIKKNPGFMNSVRSGKLDQFGVKASKDVIAAIDLAEERVKQGHSFA